jgi:hypothetical protein
MKSTQFFALMTEALGPGWRNDPKLDAAAKTVTRALENENALTVQHFTPSEMEAGAEINFIGIHPIRWAKLRQAYSITEKDDELGIVGFLVP